jgi:hypothetical protein
MLSVFIMSAFIACRYAECHYDIFIMRGYAECHYA